MYSLLLDCKPFGKCIVHPKRCAVPCIVGLRDYPSVNDGLEKLRIVLRGLLTILSFLIGRQWENHLSDVFFSSNKLFSGVFSTIIKITNLVLD